MKKTVEKKKKNENEFYKMSDFLFTDCIRRGKRYWEVGTIDKKNGRMIYLVKWPKMVHKRHLDQAKSWHLDEENDTPVDVEPMEVLYDKFDIPFPRKAPETKIQS